jgi:mono/diheme cytochrome c family protein
LTVRLLRTPGFSQTRQAGDLRVTLQLDRPEYGRRVADVFLRDAGGRPVNGPTVHLQLDMPNMDMGELAATAEAAGDGRYRAEGVAFSMAGTWVITATISGADRPPVSVPFMLGIAVPGEVAGAPNPLPADDATRKAGRDLYVRHCASCHGDTGRGDGAAGRLLNPPPADFGQHMQPGQHSDGQVFVWIRDGFPGTAMPGWGEQLSEEQIWQLVTYVRTFGQTVPGAPTAITPMGTAGPPADVRGSSP